MALLETASVTREFPYPLPTLDPSRPIGIVIAGESQAGKSTLKNYIAGTLQSMDPEGHLPPSFPLSNGFRAVTHEALTWGREQYGDDWAPDGEMAAIDLTEEYVGARLAHDDAFDGRLDAYYRTPLSDAQLRTAEINAVVPIVSEHEFIHPRIIAAAGRHARTMRHEPEAVGLERSPAALVLDGRNKEELTAIIEEADMTLGGLFVLTCNEADSVRRRWAGSVEGMEQEVQQQKRRNQADRNRPASVGPTTLPQDIRGIVPLHREIGMHEIDDPVMWGSSMVMLYTTGIAAARRKGMGIHIATDDAIGWSLEREAKVITPLVHGMVQGSLFSR